MNWLEFVAALVGALAWPVTLVVILYWFSRNLPSLFPFIDRLKYKDFEVHFRAEVKQIAAQFKIAPPAQLEKEDQPVDVWGQVFALAEVSPRSAILEAWLNVETWAIQRIQSLKKVPRDRLKSMAPLRLGKLLEEANVLTSNQMVIFNKLRDLRNQAVHVSNAQFSTEDVVEYLDLARAMARAIRASSHPAHGSNQT
jgi:hypothetical protein